VRASEGPRTARECEVWFLDHGLPWFVATEDQRVARALERRRVWRPALLVAVAAVVAGLVTGLTADDTAGGVLAAVATALALAAGWAAIALRGTVIARWAARRTVREVGVMFPLVTRALPLLLLFTTFLFINTEVWQVASSLQRSVLWSAVLLFAAVAVVFLLVRLPEELDGVTERVGDGRADLTRRQRANLLLVLLVTQALQVLVLAASVFAFFVVFGLVAIQPDVVETWLEHPPTARRWSLGGFGVTLPVSNELFQVSVFLAAFSGLYFTVYAVSDQSYREQFFTRVSGQLERAVEVHARYVAARADGDAD
jgi:Ca2+/Na+ antiporter